MVPGTRNEDLLGIVINGCVKQCNWIRFPTIIVFVSVMKKVMVFTFIAWLVFSFNTSPDDILFYPRKTSYITMWQAL